MFRRFFLNEMNMMAAIALNAVIIFLLYFPSLENNTFLALVEESFILLYLVEAVVKIRALGRQGYFSDPWNRFDFVIVAASVPSLFLHLLPLPDTSMVVLLRLFRLVRLIRFLRFVPHVAKILEGLGRALKASLFVLLALFFLNFVLALFTCHFFRDVVPEYFGNPLLASYSIFQMFTIEGWNEIPLAIARNTDSDWLAAFARVYFIAIVLLGGIFGMSLANAIFVDEMTVDNNRGLERQVEALHREIAELKKLVERLQR
ncbi:MAG: ion transporter [Bacteroidetes bacterium]|nr:MAG: ion transporter [Bacteroidota bacterium]